MEKTVYKKRSYLYGEHEFFLYEPLTLDIIREEYNNKGEATKIIYELSAKLAYIRYCLTHIRLSHISLPTRKINCWRIMNPCMCRVSIVVPGGMEEHCIRVAGY